MLVRIRLHYIADPVLLYRTVYLLFSPTWSGSRRSSKMRIRIRNIGQNAAMYSVLPQPYNPPLAAVFIPRSCNVFCHAEETLLRYLRVISLKSDRFRAWPPHPFHHPTPTHPKKCIFCRVYCGTTVQYCMYIPPNTKIMSPTVQTKCSIFLHCKMFSTIVLYNAIYKCCGSLHSTGIQYTYIVVIFCWN